PPARTLEIYKGPGSSIGTAGRLAIGPNVHLKTKAPYRLVSQCKSAMYLLAVTSAGVANKFNNLIVFPPGNVSQKSTSGSAWETCSGRVLKQPTATFCIKRSRLDQYQRRQTPARQYAHRPA